VKQRHSDHWSEAATYEQFMGRWSRKLAHEFVRWLRPGPHLHWLEVGCGTGALTAAICETEAPASVVACDPAAPFIEYARQQLDDTRASFVVAGADDFPVRAGGYDVATSLLALNFFPAPDAALQRMKSALTFGGVCSACVWDYAGEMEVLRYFWDAAAEIDKRARELDEGVRFPLCTHDNLERLFNDAGLVSVQCEPVEIVTEFDNFDDYWAPLLGGTGPAPAFVASLKEEKRANLRDKLESALPRESDGKIRLRARAWAACGNKSLELL
jgi:SAM-dependent methyltransferase